MNKSKFFTYSMIGLFLVILISLFLFGNLVSAQEEFSRPAELIDVLISLERGIIEGGEEQIVTTKIINMGLEEAEDILIEYILWDNTKTTRLSEYSESIAVQTTVALVKKIYIPEGLPSGNYIIDVNVIYGKDLNKKASASGTFIIKSTTSFLNFEKIIIGIGIFISLALLYLIYLLKKRTYKK